MNSDSETAPSDGDKARWRACIDFDGMAVDDM